MKNLKSVVFCLTILSLSFIIHSIKLKDHENHLVIDININSHLDCHDGDRRNNTDYNGDNNDHHDHRDDRDGGDDSHGGDDSDGEDDRQGGDDSHEGDGQNYYDQLTYDLSKIMNAEYILNNEDVFNYIAEEGFDKINANQDERIQYDEALIGIRSLAEVQMELPAEETSEENVRRLFAAFLQSIQLEPLDPLNPQDPPIPSDGLSEDQFKAAMRFVLSRISLFAQLNVCQTNLNAFLKKKQIDLSQLGLSDSQTLQLLIDFNRSRSFLFNTESDNSQNSENLEGIFNSLDTNGDRVLNYDEIRVGLHQLLQSITDESISSFLVERLLEEFHVTATAEMGLDGFAEGTHAILFGLYENLSRAYCGFVRERIGRQNDFILGQPLPTFLKSKAKKVTTRKNKKLR